MKRRIIWWVVSGLMVLSLVLASCAPKVAEEKKEVVTEKKEVVTEKKEVTAEKKEVVTQKEGVEMVVDALGRSVPKPQYGGWLNLAEATGPSFVYGRSDIFREPHSSGWMYLTNEQLAMTNRFKGPAGSGERLGLYNLPSPPQDFTGQLAESWEIILPDTLIFKIRKGIPWQDKAPVSGMELTPEDVVYSWLIRYKTPTSIYPSNAPYFGNLKNPEKAVYIHPDDPWKVVIKSNPGELSLLWELAAREFIEPKALGPIEGPGFGDWRGVVGTGPFLLTDYVRESSLTWQRNPNYWMKDPFHPGNQLPYLDGVKMFIIPDLSTQQAALRTGKIDLLHDVALEQGQNLIRTTPELLKVEKLGGLNYLAMRHDVAPFNNVKVRQAMMMAIDHDEIVRDYYGGKAEKFYYPAVPIAEYKDAYMPLEQMPEVVKEMFGYYPDKAKKLLAEAGYPNGFTTSVTVSSASEENIDLASIVAAYWAKVGVILKIDVKEPAVLSTMQRAFSYPHGVMGSLNEGELTKFRSTAPWTRTNYARINEPLIEQTYNRVTEAYWDWAEVARISREVMPKMQELALLQFLPGAYEFNLWQPWLKGYYGERYVDRHSSTAAYLPIARYVWIDQGLKKAMGR